jgi:hypothetical protein
MNSDVKPAWTLEAERLFPDLLQRLAREPDRKKKLDDVLEFFPRDSDKIAYLRYAHVQNIAPDDPVLFATVQFLGMLVALSEYRLQPATSDIVASAEHVAQTLKGSASEMARLSRILVRQSTLTVEKSDGLRETIESFSTLVTGLGTTLDTAADARVQAHVSRLQEVLEERAQEAIRVTSGPLIDQTLRAEATTLLEAFTEAKERVVQLSDIAVQVRDAMRPAVAAANETTKVVPLIERWIKIPRRDARVAATAGALMLTLGVAVGYSAHQPQPSFTATPDIIHAVTMGADYFAIRDKLDPATRAKVEQAITRYIAP